jgi:hypothetical protein
MARGRIMLQLEVTQYLGEGVAVAPEVEALVFDSLDGGVSTVREIAFQKLAFLGRGSNVRLTQTTLDRALTQVYLVSARGETPLTVLYGPSVVPSPPVSGPELVILRVFDIGFSVPPPPEIFVGRLIQAHAYVDESEPGLPTLPAPDGGVIGP